MIRAAGKTAGGPSCSGLLYLLTQVRRAGVMPRRVGIAGMRGIRAMRSFANGMSKSRSSGWLRSPNVFRREYYLIGVSGNAMNRTGTVNPLAKAGRERVNFAYRLVDF